MYLEQKKVAGTGGIPVFQIVHETAQGGFGLDASGAGLTTGSVLKAGTPMTYDEATRLAKPAKADGTDVKGLLYEDTDVDQSEPISVVVRGTVYARRVKKSDGTAYTFPDAIKKALPLIVFSNSF